MLAFGVAVVWFSALRLLRIPRALHALRFTFDLLPDVAAIFLALVLAAVGIALFFLPEEVRQLENRRRLRLWIAGALMSLSVVFGLGGVISDSVRKREDKDAAKQERDRLTGMLSSLIEQQKLTATNLELQKAQIGTLASQSIPELATRVNHIAKPSAQPPPEVTLGFVYPKDPCLVIRNPSDSIARDIKWMVALWNMDLPERNDPLPIPAQIFDWLRPHSEGGPQILFDTPLVTPLLKAGNRLFGSASVLCPGCKRGRTFVVYIVWGEGGWFSEVEAQKSGNPLIPTNFLRDTREAYFRQLEALVPGKSRIAIRER
jgi:hypothetical protein